MKTLKIKKVEMNKGGGFFSVTFDTQSEIEQADFDLDQLGTDITYISSFSDMVMVAGTVTLKAGDSITDDFGGQPIIGANRQAQITKDMSIVPTVDYRDAFQSKLTA